MTKRPETDSGAIRPRKNNSPPDIFARNQKRGIDYNQIKQIVHFDRPDQTLRFAQWFRGRTIEGVLKHFEKWRDFLKKDFILLLSSDVKGQVKQFLFGTEWLVWKALIEANPYVGLWDLQYRFLPTDQDEKGRPLYFHPTIRIEAVHRETKEVRKAQIPDCKSADAAGFTAAYRKAFNELGLWTDMWKGDPSRFLVSNRRQHAWPVFTKFIIPRLYEFMLPHYNLAPHYSEKLDSANMEPKRSAMYSKELLQDMLEILKIEHDWAFQNATVRRLKGVIQRHMARKTTQTTQQP